MANLNEKMQEYFIKAGLTKSEYKEMLTCTVDIAMAIAIYSHRGQFRLNGQAYCSHAISCMNLYRTLVGIEDDGKFFDLDLMYEKGVQFEGVQEVALLHDVLEDTETTLDEIQQIYYECGYQTYFEVYIKQALILITHDKSESYEIYIGKMIDNPIASLCKMLDLADNMNLCGLATLKDAELDRCIRYAKYFKQLNDRWHFLENSLEYKKQLASEKD